MLKVLARGHTYTLEVIKVTFDEELHLQKIINKIIDNGYPIAVLAKKTGCDSTTIGKWRTGKRNLSDKLLDKIYNTVIDLQQFWIKIME